MADRASLRNCGEIDFKTKQGEDCMLYHTEKLFMLIKDKYEMYGIDEKPHIMIKADSGIRHGDYSGIRY